MFRTFSGVLYTHYGYQCVFWGSACLNLIGMVNAAVVMKFNLSHNASTESIFSFKILTDTLTVAFKQRGQGRRGLVLLLICSFTLFEIPFPIDDNLLYLYFKV